jgi:hypothetical protein
VLALDEVQARFYGAVVGGDATGITPLLTGGRDPQKRLAVHQRHYQTSLAKALVERFPATVWLIGTPFVTEAAQIYIRKCPPQAPCIAEYGEDFPRFLSGCVGIERVPYLHDFAKLEWHIGHIAIAIDRAVVTLDDLSNVSAEELPDMGLILQPGLRYLHSSWLIDELMNLYLAQAAPERFELTSGDLWLEVRGARGEFQFSRLNAADFVFRKSVAEGSAVGEAAECALDVDDAFNPGQALAALVVAGLVTAIEQQL